MTVSAGAALGWGFMPLRDRKEDRRWSAGSLSAPMRGRPLVVGCLFALLAPSAGRPSEPDHAPRAGASSECFCRAFAHEFVRNRAMQRRSCGI